MMRLVANLARRYRKYLKSASTFRDETENYISQADAARIRGVSNQAIADLIKRGRLTSVSIAGRKLLLRSEVEAFVAKPKLGRPPKKVAKRTVAMQSKGKKATKRSKVRPS